jgi:hypothetical protein
VGDGNPAHADVDESEKVNSIQVATILNKYRQARIVENGAGRFGRAAGSGRIR